MATGTVFGTVGTIAPTAVSAPAAPTGSPSMPAGGGIQYQGQWYTTAQYQQLVASGGGPASSAGGSSQATLDGKQILQDFLNRYDLTGINLNDAWSAYVGSGSNLDYWSNTWLTQQQAFQTQYPAYQQLMKEGRGITIADYRNYIQTANQLAQQSGFPQGFVNQDMITKSLLNGVSTSELQQRFSDASKTVNSIPAEDRAYLANEIGVSQGDLAAYWLDPAHALPLIENKLAAAQIGGSAARAGVGLDQGVAGQLAALGTTPGQADQGFGQIAADKQLYSALPGQQGDTFSQAQQVGAEFGTDPAAKLALQNVTAQRLAPFKAGGGYASTSAGLVGAGVAQGA